MLSFKSYSDEEHLKKKKCTSRDAIELIKSYLFHPSTPHLQDALNIPMLHHEN